MPDPADLDPDLTALAARLAGLTPAAPALDRDRLFFAAGRRAAGRRAWAWPLATGLCAALDVHPVPARSKPFRQLVLGQLDPRRSQALQEIREGQKRIAASAQALQRTAFCAGEFARDAAEIAAAGEKLKDLIAPLHAQLA